MSNLIMELIPSQIPRGNWYGIVKDLDKNKVIWCSDQQRKKSHAQRQAKQKLKEFKKNYE